MNPILDILFIIGVRFWIFDSSMFKWIRQYLKSYNNWIVNKLLKCSFCQGFWLGTIYYLIIGNCLSCSIWFGFISAGSCLSWYVLTDNAIIEVDKRG